MISASEIADREKSRRSIRKETYKSILEQFSKKIKACSERKERSATLLVPPLVIGFPMFPYDEALMYIHRQLVLAGYQVQQGLDQGQFIVRWDRPTGSRPAKKKEAPMDDPTDDVFFGLANMQKVAAKLRGK